MNAELYNPSGVRSTCTGFLVVAIAATVLISAAGPTSAAAQDTDPVAAESDTLREFNWPSVIEMDSGFVTIYQPQVDSLTEDDLYSRAAISYTKNDGQPVFGVGIFKSRVDVDRDSRTVALLDLSVTEARFHGRDEDYSDRLDDLIVSNGKNWDIVLSLDELLTSIAASQELRKPAESFKTDPPVILYEDGPALLVLIDGDPVLTEIENSSVKAVINTPYPLLYDGSSYYLTAAKDVWYRASAVKGPWSFDASPPESITKLVPPPSAEQAEELGQTEAASTSSEPITAANAPKILVATEPTELITTDGDPTFEPVAGSLKGVSNSDDNLFYDSESLLYYVVLSGRWYQSGAIEGPYSYVASDALPAEFKQIPSDSDYADVSVYVAGTVEAREAVVDSYIPQTAAIERGEVELDVDYDGDPKFEKIEETDLEYATNTGDSIIKSGTKFYLVRDGVWYISDGPNGPWEVSDHAPEGVEDIPPSNPTYNVKYVYVYETTPEVVYVGYTPGYYGSYVYGPTIVYGTGWWYRPYVTPYYYYPRAPTWGFHVSYNPWTGWGFGMSWSYGPFRFGFYSGGYWHHGHGWYRPPYHYHRPYPHHYNRYNNAYRNPSQRARVDHRAANRTPGARPSQRPSGGAGAGVATRPSQRPSGGAGAGVATRPSTRPSDGAAARPSTRDNNVYAGRDGNVYRRDNSGNWDRNSGGTWNQQSRSGATTSQLDRQRESRARSQTRNQQYRSSRGGSRSYGGGRRGGRR